MYRLELEILGLPKTTNGNARRHWSYLHQEAKKWKNAVKFEVMKHGKPSSPLTRASLTLTRHSSVSPDADGLVSSFKSCIDGLIEAGILENDRMNNIGMPDYRWEQTKRGYGFITIVVEERPWS